MAAYPVPNALLLDVGGNILAARKGGLRMPKIGGGEIIIILVVVILLFGAKKLPELARSLGSSAREFRKGVEEGRTEEAADGSADQVSATTQSATTTSTET